MRVVNVNGSLVKVPEWHSSKQVEMCSFGICITLVSCAQHGRPKRVREASMGEHQAE